MRKVFSSLFLSAVAAVTLLSAAAAAQAPPDLEKRLADLDKAAKSAQSAGDNAWMLVSAALVLMMTGPGAGAVLRRAGAPQERARHHDAQLHPDGRGDGAVGGGRLQHGVRRMDAVLRRRAVRVPARTWARAPNADYAATIPQQTFMIYQLMFAIITPALISGAFAERMKFSAMLLFTDAVVADRVLSRWRTWCGARADCFNATPGRKDSVPSISRAERWCTSPRAFRRWCARCIWASARDIRVEPMRPHSLVLSIDGRVPAVGGLVRIQRGQRAGGIVARRPARSSRRISARRRRRWAGCSRNGCTPASRACWARSPGAVAGLVAITPASGFVKPFPAMLIGAGGGRGLLLDGHRGEDTNSATTIRSTRSACTARAERWARC